MRKCCSPSAASLIAFLSLYPLAACNEAGKDSGIQRTDSAGIEIVTIAASSVRELPWRLDDQPTAVVRGDDPDALMTSVMGAVRTSSGQFLVQGYRKGGNFFLLLFDSTGSRFSPVGRKGRGPGEFQAVTGAGVLANDSIWAYDVNLARLSVFTASGNFARSASIAETRVGCEPIGAFVDGSMAVRCFTSVSGNLVANEYLHITSEGATRGSIISDTVPLGPTMGYHAPVFANGARYLYRGSPESYEIRTFATGGKMVRSVRIGLDPHVLTAAEIARQTETNIALAVAGGVPEEQAREHARGSPIPERMAVWARIFEDPDGNVWAMENRMPWDVPRRWFVFAPTGELLGWMKTPPGLQVFQIGRDFMLVGTEDEDGVQFLERRRLVRSPAGED